MWWYLICGALIVAALIWLAWCVITAPVHDEDRDGPWVPPVK